MTDVPGPIRLCIRNDVDGIAYAFIAPAKKTADEQDPPDLEAAGWFLVASSRIPERATPEERTELSKALQALGRVHLEQSMRALGLSMTSVTTMPGPKPGERAS